MGWERVKETVNWGKERREKKISRGLGENLPLRFPTEGSCEKAVGNSYERGKTLN